ncbi:MAG: addiction module antidote protein [Novosphingobium meiothermophilum]|uniref:addiction module antidote protein n=1 Tax=Novosphingobium TaxID=165696 RepID=UPI000D6E7C66|nr:MULTISPECIES: addiction module antidote protein [Novosphingobium]
MALELKTYDVAEHLTSEEEIRLYLDAAFEDGDAAIIANALGNVARARGMTRIASEAGISRAGLYKAVGENGNPSLQTLVALLRAFGMKLKVESAR